MTCDPNDTISSEDLTNLKENITTIDNVVELPGPTTTTPDSSTIYTLRGQLSRLGYLVPITYTAGISFTINDASKTIDRSGIVYAPKVSELPFTTSGTWAADDENKFYVIQRDKDQYLADSYTFA